MRCQLLYYFQKRDSESCSFDRISQVFAAYGLWGLVIYMVVCMPTWPTPRLLIARGRSHIVILVKTTTARIVFMFLKITEKLIGRNRRIAICYSCMIHPIEGASQSGNLRLYHFASPLRRQNHRFCLYVPRWGWIIQLHYLASATSIVISISETVMLMKNVIRGLQFMIGCV